MSIDYEHLRDILQGTLATTRYTWRDLAREVLRLHDEQERLVSQKHDHPLVLFSVEDFERAPKGTIVVDGYGIPWLKRGSAWYSPNAEASSKAMARWGELNILRWGW